MHPLVSVQLVHLSVTNLFCDWQRTSKSQCDTAFYFYIPFFCHCSTTSPFNNSGTYLCFIIGTLVVVSIIIFYLFKLLCGYICIHYYICTCKTFVLKSCRWTTIQKPWQHCPTAQYNVRVQIGLSCRVPRANVSDNYCFTCLRFGKCVVGVVLSLC